MCSPNLELASREKLNKHMQSHSKTYCEICGLYITRRKINSHVKEHERGQPIIEKALQIQQHPSADDFSLFLSKPESSPDENNVQCLHTSYWLLADKDHIYKSSLQGKDNVMLKR
jgi:hypothetical protein